MTGPGIHLQKRLSRAGKTTLIGLVAAVMSWVVLFGTLQVALGIPTEEHLSPLARAGALDYSLGRVGMFESLRASFIAKILGLDPTGTITEGGSSPDDSILAAPSTPDPITSIPGRIPRTVVEHPFDNDDFDDARSISTIPFTGKTDTSGAEREAGEPDVCEPVGGTLWYQYRPNKNLGLLASSFGSDHAVAIGVFRGRGLSDLTLVDCNANTAGNAQVVFSAEKNHSYYFQVAAPISGGKLVFSLDPLGTTSLVSIARNGRKAGNADSTQSSVSAHGRYVAFVSVATNLTRRKGGKKACLAGGPRDEEEGDPRTDCPDIYLRDLRTGRTELISKSSRGAWSNGRSEAPAISGNGRYVAFYSTADNLVPHDDNDAGDFFVHDRIAHTTERVSVSSEGQEGTNPWSSNPYCKTHGGSPISLVDDASRELCALVRFGLSSVGISISGNGRYVAFASSLHGLVDPEPPHCTDVTGQDYAAQTNHGPGVPLPADSGQYACRQIYVHDRKTGETRLASVSSDGEPGQGDSAAPYISRNGKWVVFSSSASDLVDVDENHYRDVFVHNLRSGTTELVSVSPFGEQGDAQSGGTNQRGHQSVSDNGRWIAFVSHASNLSSANESHVDNMFLRDMKTDDVVLISGAAHSVLSADGRYIAYTEAITTTESESSTGDLFVYDRITDTITRVSVAGFGQTADDTSQEPEISADGHFVVFFSAATNLDRRHQDDPGNDVFIHELPWTR